MATPGSKSPGALLTCPATTLWLCPLPDLEVQVLEVVVEAVPEVQEGQVAEVQVPAPLPAATPK